ncbi:MAG TPA: hypothetical protein VG815_14610, partial [Chloroflexota bacterium]|nr:hypothetical protein [Chloroflexota bacterium]
MIRSRRILIAVLALVPLFVASSDITQAPRAPDLVIGVNLPELKNPKDPRTDQENATLTDLKAAGVRVLRAGVAPTEQGLDYVKRMYAAGFKLHWIVGLQFPPNAPQRPWRPTAFPGMWAGPPLSYADPNLFRTYTQSLLDKLEAMGVKLAALELGNELNMAAFNPEFPLPGAGKQFGLSDLANDPEAKQIAKGYLRYLESLAVLKEVRDHSKLNQHTPILTAGFGAYEAPEGQIGKAGGADLVSVNATLQFMRTNGLDKLVDAYAVHVYPWANGPGDAAAAAGRQSRLAKYVLAQCRPAGSTDGKPCWITEWGFKNTDTTCPAHEASQVSLIEEMRSNFRPYIQERRLTG